jgi:chain length determinant protein tyrosine kinase EpsG
MNVRQPHGIRSVPLSVPSRSTGSSVSAFGGILVDAGRLTPADVERILDLQLVSGTRFGEVGQTLGLMTPDDVRYALSVQFDYPYLPRDSSLSRELVAAYQPDSPAVEDLRALRSQLMLRWFDTVPERKGLAIVSAGAGEGRSYLAANLAIVFSQLGARTLLVDADLRTPRQQQLFNLGQPAGLSEMLVGRAGAEALVGIAALRDLSVLPAGVVPPNPQELLGRRTFPSLLRSFGDDFEIIIIDTPAASGYADAQTVAARAGAALVVARQDSSSLPQLAELTQGLRGHGVNVLGSVLNAA